VPFGDAEVLAEEVCGYGPDVRVVDPPEVRDAVVRRLRAIVGSSAAEAG
jgi:proteasome accessory factor B